jgi:hypothetical protein
MIMERNKFVVEKEADLKLLPPTKLTWDTIQKLVKTDGKHNSRVITVAEDKTITTVTSVI